MLEVCQSHGVPILEDDCYVDLRFEGEDVTSISSIADSGGVLYVGSMSKIIAPGVRMGYLVAPEVVRERVLSFKSGGVNQFAALAIEECLRNHMYDHISVSERNSPTGRCGRHLRKCIGVNHDRCGNHLGNYWDRCGDNHHRLAGPAPISRQGCSLETLHWQGRIGYVLLERLHRVQGAKPNAH